MVVKDKDNKVYLAPGSLKAAGWLGALGVVYGDIGTSPIYTLGACLRSFSVIGKEEILGSVSLILWLLTLVVSIKYIHFITRADNRGEGGVCALLSLINCSRWHIGPTTKILLVGMALLYGEAIITPAISILSSVEGLEKINPSLQPLVMPVSIAILTGLFMVQSQGTGKLGQWLGPIMLIWFSVLGLLGLQAIYQSPDIMYALNPYWACNLVLKDPKLTATLLGAATLAITGAEALYADMGHFGRGPIATAWYKMVMPALAINYLGQGALALTSLNDAKVLSSPFFSLVDPGLPAACLTALSAIATVVASQAMITGIFSLTRQAVQLGFFPHMKIIHTNSNIENQIYIPFINALLACCVVTVILIFGSSDALSHAYGVAVTGTMAVTSFGFFQYCQNNWRMQWHNRLFYSAVISIFFIVDVSLFGSNLLKLVHGGYLPLMIAACVYTIMYTWRSGRLLLAHYLSRSAIAMEDFIKNLDLETPHVPGVAVFMSANPVLAPTVLLYHMRYTKVRYEHMIVMTVLTDIAPKTNQQPQLEDLGQGVYRLIAHVGYMESVNVPMLLQNALTKANLRWPSNQVLYFFNHDLALTNNIDRYWQWQKDLFSFLLRCSRPAYYYFKIPAPQIIEMGIPLEL